MASNSSIILSAFGLLQVVNARIEVVPEPTPQPMRKPDGSRVPTFWPPNLCHANLDHNETEYHAWVTKRSTRTVEPCVWGPQDEKNMGCPPAPTSVIAPASVLCTIVDCCLPEVPVATFVKHEVQHTIQCHWRGRILRCA
jgi:hypothetical protein